MRSIIQSKINGFYSYVCMYIKSSIDVGRVAHIKVSARVFLMCAGEHHSRDHCAGGDKLTEISYSFCSLFFFFGRHTRTFYVHIFALVFFFIVYNLT